MAGAGHQDSDVSAAALLRGARVRRGMSQRDLARAAGVPQSTVSAIESGRRQPTVAMLGRLVAAAGFRIDATLVNTIRPSDLLDRKRGEVARIIARYPVSAVWVFGSVARGDDRPGSDLDLLVELEADASFADWIDLADELADALGCPVDVVTTKELQSNALFRRRVQDQRRPLDLAA